MQSFSFEVDTLRYKDGKKRRDKKTVTVQIPTKPEEITLRTWSDYSALRANCPKWFEQITIGQETDFVVPDGGWQQLAQYCLEVISTLAINRDELSETDLLSLPMGDYQQSTDGLLAITAMMLRPVDSYQPKERGTFTHRGHEYAMYTSYVDQFKNEWVGKEMRTAEAVDALQLEQVFFQKDEKGELYQDDAVYRNLLSLTAMLTRRIMPDGTLEYPPVRSPDRNIWLDERMRDLSDMDMTVGLDIDFFLPDSKSAFQTILKSALRGRMAALQQRQKKVAQRR